MHADYFDKHASIMPTLTRLKKEGAWYSQARTNVLPTVTGVGHANIGTGTDPRIHGIVVNNLFNRATGKSQEAYDQLDTKELMALTLADEWNLTTDGKAIIIGQGARSGGRDWWAEARCLSDQRPEGSRRQLRRGGWRMGNQSRVLHDAGGVEGVHRPQGLGSRWRYVDGPRHLELR